MKARSTALSVGSVIAALGGVAALMMMASIFDVDAENIMPTVCTYLLTIVLFFAVAGGFKVNGQWNYNMFVVMEFVLFAVIIAATLVDLFTTEYGVILLIMAVLSLICVLVSGKGKVWLNKATD